MVSIDERYLNYYQDVASEDTRKALLDDILSAPTPNINTRLEWPQATFKHISTNLATNGTVSDCELYEFGPHPHYWLFHIERYLKGNHYAHTVGLVSKLFHNSSCLGHSYRSTDYLTFAKGMLDIDIKTDVHYFVKVLISLYQQYGPLNILTNANDLLYFNTNSIYRSAFEQLKGVIASFINTDIALLFNNRLPIPIRDQMINWRSGVNYYHCQYDKCHVLPISQNGINLLNYYPSKDDDEVSYTVGHLCECGKHEIDLKINFHRYRIPPIILDLYNKITGCYRSLQFKLSDGRCDVAYVGSMGEHDRELIKVTMRAFGCGDIHNQKIYEVGQKIPPIVHAGREVLIDVSNEDSYNNCV